MNKKLVSVIIPVYNVEQYLGRCVNSVLNQSYTNLEAKWHTPFPCAFIIAE